MKINVGNKGYVFLIGYQDETLYRSAFNDLAQKIFGLSFETWYQSGYWRDQYIPYTLFDGPQAVANISVNLLTFNLLGQQRQAVQLGTGMTDEAYRKERLYIFLAKYILNEWGKRCDFIYFYANNKALSSLYPKMGFTAVKEHQYYKTIPPLTSSAHYQKLDMSLLPNRKRLYEYAKNSLSFSKIAIQGNADLVMFYCTSPLQEGVYYIEALDVFAIATFEPQQLHLWDIFSKHDVLLDDVISILANPSVTEVYLGFTPNDNKAYRSKEIKGEETLFVPKVEASLFENNKLMFPLLSHA